MEQINLSKILLLSVTVALTLFAIERIWRNLGAIQELEGQLEIVLSEKQDLQEKIAREREELLWLQDPEFLYYEAQERLGLVPEGMKKVSFKEQDNPQHLQRK